ncbi:hypothetical protein [Segetibacter koreensis]|uniref:hypothetical protein n=1 Tax=Segetibacter koreensis TaxID=398037 RepID=UPI00036C56FA|nr:hypothetical protein [Segetibacter koreensis]
MSKHQTYKESLLSALDCLDDAAGHAISAVLNIAFAGQYKELGRLYEQGEILQVEPEMFEDIGDVNIDLILKLIVNINETKASIRNLNSM